MAGRAKKRANGKGKTKPKILCGDFGGVTARGSPCKRKKKGKTPGLCLWHDPESEMKNQGGRPEAKVDVKALRLLAGVHCSYRMMAAKLGVSVDTLERRYAETIKAERAVGEADLLSKQFELAKDGDRTMLIWLGKQYLDQREPQRIEFGGIPDQPIEVVERVVYRLPDNERGAVLGATEGSFSQLKAGNGRKQNGGKASRA